MIEAIYDLIEQVRNEFAPDPRTAVFEVDVTRERNGGLVLEGAVSDPGAAEALRERIGTLDLATPIRDAVTRIPDSGAATLPHGIVIAAVAPMLAGPVVSQSHLSQVLLGNRVLVLREHGRWLQCRSTDGYLGWIHRGYLRRMTEAEARAWEIGAVAPMRLSLGAEVVATDSDQTLARLPWGARFGYRSDEAVLPNGETGRLVGESVPLEDLSSRFPQTGRALVASARRWVGAPYLWGGTTPAGVDCSGLAQAIFRTHRVELPRDSDQQVSAGSPVDPSDANGCLPGDLLFFAEQKDRISHVAISTGGWGVIHSALGNGGVRENDLTGRSGYERELRSLLVAVRRFRELER